MCELLPNQVLARHLFFLTNEVFYSFSQVTLTFVYLKCWQLLLYYSPIIYPPIDGREVYVKSHE